MAALYEVIASALPCDSPGKATLRSRIEIDRNVQDNARHRRTQTLSHRVNGWSRLGNNSLVGIAWADLTSKVSRHHPYHANHHDALTQGRRPSSLSYLVHCCASTRSPSNPSPASLAPRFALYCDAWSRRYSDPPLASTSLSRAEACQWWDHDHETDSCVS